MYSKIKKVIQGDENLKELFFGSIVTFFLKIGGMILGYIAMVVIARQYGPETVGYYSIVVSVIMGLSIFSCAGMNISVLRFIGQLNTVDECYKLRVLYKHILQITIPLSFGLSIFLFLFSGTIAEVILNDLR